MSIDLDTPTFVGAKVFSIGRPEKRDFLLFDQIVSAGTEMQIKLQADASARAELEWLVQQGLVVDLEFFVSEQGLAEGNAPTILPDTSSLWLFGAAVALMEANRDFSESEVVDREPDEQLMEDTMALFSTAYQKMLDQSVRFTTDAVRMRGISCTPIRDSVSGITPSGIRHNSRELVQLLQALPPDVRWHQLFTKMPMDEELRSKLRVLRPIPHAIRYLKRIIRGDESALNEVPALELVLNSLPVPDETVPWEQLLDFRSDPDTRYSLLTLRRWIRKVTRENIGTAELREELRYLLAQYEQRMRQHKMKHHTSTLKAIVSVSAEFVSNVLGHRVVGAAESLFKVRELQIAQREAELSLHGQEVAYIFKARDAFGQ